MLRFKTKHFLTGEELSRDELLGLIERAEEMRLNRSTNADGPLKGKTVALMFEKPSLRTRVSFTVGVQELGGFPLEIDSSKTKSEEPEDSTRVLQGMVHGIMLRTFKHDTLTRMTSVAKVPIINGLSDDHHPCQAIADLQTLRQRFGKLQGLKLAYIGDGNNVLHSLLLMLPFVGVDVHFACPDGYSPDPEILKRAQARAAQTGAKIKEFKTPSEAVKGVNAIYTDVWVSMGQEGETAKRQKIFKNFQVNAKLYSLAAKKAIVLHCLPMLKGWEITADIVEHANSAIFDQAANRLHAQKALMEGLFSPVTSTVKKSTAKVAKTAGKSTQRLSVEKRV
jgi:ornithine carbamoyltransferase